MNYLFISTILIVGLSGLVAQTLLLRELLVSFYGNELTLGVILANWVILEAGGVFIIGKIIDKVRNKINVFIALEVIFSLLLPVSVYLCRVYKGILGIPVGEAMGLSAIFWVSLFIILPVSFCHGALFSAGCKISSMYTKEPAASIGKVYAWETLGTILGGIIMTYLFIPYLNSFAVAYIISAANLIACLGFLKITPKTKLKYIIFTGIIFMLCVPLTGALNYIQRYSINKQFKGSRVLDYRNSIYGNIVVTKQREQYTFFYNGMPVITAPYPDITFTEEFAHLPLLFHGAAKDVLIISAGAAGIINEALKHPVRKIDYVEIDSLIIGMLKKYPTALTESELKDSRVNIINLDGRYFLKTKQNRYDIVLVGLSKPSDLSINRLFTQEFFALVKNRLNPDGVLALWLPGSLVYLSQELKDLNACILNALKSTYGYVRIIPGDYNIFLASDSHGVMAVTPGVVTQRILKQNIQSKILTFSYIDYRLSQYWLDWFIKSSQGATRKANQDFKPVAVFQMLILWNKQFSLKSARILSALGNLDLKAISLAMLAATILIFYAVGNTQRVNLTIAYSIATTGFFAMLSNLILIFGFQVFYGYLYHRIGLLISIFMAGIAAGSIFITGRTEKIKNVLSLFMKIEALIIAFACIMAFTITRLIRLPQYASLIFIALFFIAGLLGGLEFPLAGKISLGKDKKIGGVSGLLYCSDLIGGWFAGILGGVCLLPVLGLFSTCIVIIIVKLSSLTLLYLKGRLFCQSAG